MARRAARQAEATATGTEKTPPAAVERDPAPVVQLDPLIMALSRAVQRLEGSAG